MVPRGKGANLRSNPAIGVRNAGKTKGPVDEEVIVLKFDTVAGEGVDDFKFAV